MPLKIRFSDHLQLMKPNFTWGGFHTKRFQRGSSTKTAQLSSAVTTARFNRSSLLLYQDLSQYWLDKTGKVFSRKTGRVGSIIFLLCWVRAVPELVSVGCFCWWVFPSLFFLFCTSSFFVSYFEPLYSGLNSFSLKCDTPNISSGLVIFWVHKLYGFFQIAAGNLLANACVSSQ